MSHGEKTERVVRHICRVCSEPIKEHETPYYDVGLTGDIQKWHKDCDSKRKPRGRRPR